MKQYLFFLLMTSCQYMNMYPDNPIEEAVEAAIEKETGISVDFTGESKEK